ncbi:mitochondria-eating protein isoform X1 [Corvus moneduloides]|uniref:Mitochondria-eating protein n=1 Tax=Corvus moneduloides TaxID=1196302 RepID=A0A8C3ET79_CORMO|nr:mitochondria-eating protein isoform X1 [Corvus moneduloides]
MAQDLRSLVGSGSARELQEKLENWQRDYEMNSFGENLNRCCEILELNTAIQKRLFSILNETSREDTLNEGADTIKNRLLPSLASGGEKSLSITEGSLGGELQLRDSASNQSCQLQELEDKLYATRVQIKQMEQDPRASRAEECKALRQLQQLNDYEQEIQTLRHEISLLDAQKSLLQSRLVRSRSPFRCSVSKSRSAVSVRTWSPARAGRVNASHRACIIARFGFIYAQERLDAETLLRAFICDMETVQRIIYIAAVESFRAAKMAFWKLKISVKETLALDHVGPESLEVAALDYIARHKDLYDVCQSVQEVVCSMNVNPKIPYPPEVDFFVIRTLIRELCCLAFSMQTLIPPLDIALGVDGELFNRTMYYRSCDSDFTAPFVAYHVWPALMENGAVIVKGEVVTKKIVLCSRRRRIRSRSCSCGRRLRSGQVTRSRSLSTVRVKTSRY